MGVIKKGILGGFSGKVGNVIGGSWKGIEYMRVKPASVANPRTEGQVNQRTKFTVSLQFLQPMTDFIQVGYKKLAIQKTEFNSAMSYTLKNAITGVAPDFTIDYANALLSRGSLAGAFNPLIDTSTAGQVAFSWTDNTPQGGAEATDKALLMIYNETNGEAIFTTDGASRDTETQTLPIPDSYTGNTLHLYIGFISEDGQSISNSLYIGSGVAA